MLKTPSGLHFLIFSRPVGGIEQCLGHRCSIPISLKSINSKVFGMLRIQPNIA